MEIEKRVLSVEEACKVLGCSRPKAYELVHKGILPVIKLGPHKFIIPMAALEHFLKTGQSFVKG